MVLFNNICPYNVLQISTIILSISLIIDTLNFFFKKHLYFDDSGLFSYNNLILDKRNYLKNIYIKLPFIFKYKGFYFVMLVRLICSLLLILFFSYNWIFLIFLIIAQLIFNIRNIYTLSGADQMQSIILFGVFISSFNTNGSIALLSFYFITIQLLLSYFFTGFHKIKSKNWRNGQALLLVLNSETFGNQKLLKFLYKNNNIAIFFCWLIMISQLTFVFSFFIFPQLTIIYLAVFFIFHLSIAFFMNLNHFFWVFISTYPIVFYISYLLWNR